MKPVTLVSSALLVHAIGAASTHSLWSRPGALALVNHPLVVYLGTGGLPRGSFERCLLARATVLEGLEQAARQEAKAALADSDTRKHASLRLLEKVTAEGKRCANDHAEWRTAVSAAGKTIDLPKSEIDAGVRCYACGGMHYNIDCPEELRVSNSAATLASYLRSTTSLAGASSVLTDLSFAATTLMKAGLHGGEPYGAMLGAHVQRLSVLADACDRALVASGRLSDAPETCKEEFETARSLLFALVDSESSDAGLKAVQSSDAGGGGVMMGLQEARDCIEVIEPGFRASQVPARAGTRVCTGMLASI